MEAESVVPDRATLASLLRPLAEALPHGTAVPVSREWLLALVGDATSETGPQTRPDRLITAEDVAERLGISKQEVYRQAPRWSFTRKLGRRTLRFSEQGLQRWMDRRRAP